MHRAEFGSAVSPIMTMPHFAVILEITPLKIESGGLYLHDVFRAKN